MKDAFLTNRRHKINIIMFINNCLHIGYDVLLMTKHQRIEAEDLETIRAFAKVLNRSTVDFFSHLANRIRVSGTLDGKHPYADVIIIKNMNILNRLLGENKS